MIFYYFRYFLLSDKNESITKNFTEWQLCLMDNYYSLIYEAENVKNIVKHHLDTMMECYRKHANSRRMW